MRHQIQNRCSTCKKFSCASKVPIFSSLDTAQLEALSGYIQQRTFIRDENIVTEGNDIDNLIFINKGQAKAYRNSAQGRETILYIFGDGDFFGEKNVLSRQIASYSVKAIKNTEVCMMNRNDFQQIIKIYPDIALHIIDALSKRIHQLENSVERGNQDVQNRIYEVLMEFSKKHGRTHQRGILVSLPINREGIANYIGVSRETVSRKMVRLEQQGMIEMMGHKKILLLSQSASEQAN